MDIYHLLLCGLFIHIIFLLSIFDIYFKSPILKNITPTNNTINPPAKRVVLVSVDGLRVDAIFDINQKNGIYIAEFMQEIIKNYGSWGVSHARVPTESRPGHIAMLAGFYEDPSAITRGWKENPVDFDSIINKSYCSFAWGSPDILNIFFKGLQHSCAFAETYQSEQEFAGDSRKFDNWVIDKVAHFFKFSKHINILDKEKIFFFLHLLGQDTSGHTDKPHSEKYRQTLRNVDNLIKKTNFLFNNFFRDNKTTFILTSDHGMTDWGSHGSGDLEETNTPFIAWGAGIKRPTFPIKKININQADLTPLLAILLGTPIPVNSVGILPIELLNLNNKQIAEALFLNSKQIIAQYIKAVEIIKKNTFSWFQIPFKSLCFTDINTRFSLISNQIRSKQYTKAIVSSKNLIEISLKGLDYYYNYYQKFLLLCISLSYLGWIMYLFLTLNDIEPTIQFYNNFKVKIMFYIIVLISTSMLAFQKLPFLFYTYVLLPELLWYAALKKTHLVCKIKKLNIKKILYYFTYIFLGLEILVFTFFYRWFLCISMIVVLSWSLFLVNFNSNLILMILWFGSGFALTIFSCFPTIGKKPNPIMISISGVAISFLSLFVFKKGKNTFFNLLRFLTLLLSTCNNYMVHSYFEKYNDFLSFNQYFSWCLLLLSCYLVLNCNGDVFQKLIQILMSLSVPLILLSITYEVFFFMFLFIHLVCWILVEKIANNHKQYFLDFRVSYFFITYIFLSYFGLGNISSLNSFDLAWTRCFVTVFSPFLMSSLILLKIFIPFLAVTCSIWIITIVLNIQPKRLFVIVLIYCNIMGLHFLYFIKNKGSWLDIGISISHYVIQQLTTLFLIFLFGIAKILLTFSLFKTGKRSKGINDTFLNKKNLIPFPVYCNHSKVHVL